MSRLKTTFSSPIRKAPSSFFQHMENRSINSQTKTECSSHSNTTTQPFSTLLTIPTHFLVLELFDLVVTQYHSRLSMPQLATSTKFSGLKINRFAVIIHKSRTNTQFFYRPDAILSPNQQCQSTGISLLVVTI